MIEKDEITKAEYFEQKHYIRWLEYENKIIMEHLLMAGRNVSKCRIYAAISVISSLISCTLWYFRS